MPLLTLKLVLWCVVCLSLSLLARLISFSSCSFALPPALFQLLGQPQLLAFKLAYNTRLVTTGNTVDFSTVPVFFCTVAQSHSLMAAVHGAWFLLLLLLMYGRLVACTNVPAACKWSWRGTSAAPFRGCVSHFFPFLSFIMFRTDPVTSENVEHRDCMLFPSLLNSSEVQEHFKVLV